MASVARPRPVSRALWQRATTEEAELAAELAAGLAAGLALLLLLVLTGVVLEVVGTKGEGPLLELLAAPVLLVVRFELAAVALGMVAEEDMLCWPPEATVVLLPGWGEGAALVVPVETLVGAVVLKMAASQVA